MNSRKRVKKILNGGVPDRVPLDLGGSPVTGMHVSSVYRLRQALGLDEPGTPVKVIEPFQMLGEIKPDLQEALGVDIISLSGPENFFGFKNENWKPWETFDGTPVLVPEKFNTEPEENGDIYMYPQGDKTVPPCAKMPEGGYYFDALNRQQSIDENTLDIEDNLEEFGPMTEEELEYYRKEINRLYNNTDKAIFANFGDTSFGDIAHIPGCSLKNPEGIRGVEEWYISLAIRKDYIYRVFEKQCEIALKNLERIKKVVGNKISVLFVTGTDFGAQDGPFISNKTYRSLFKPFHQEVNKWVHKNTDWKTFIHSCGSVTALLDDFIEAGFDILNPVQCSAAEMEPEKLKQEYGSRIIFWGGGVNTQKTLPFGSAKEVKEEVKSRIEILGKDGGYIFNPIHNVQADTPEENLTVMYEAFEENAGY
ncbi:MAG: uroporphyrinogen decarboxylase family protein [bacterium]